ncbi:MAG: hypothetical protein WCX31_12460 [Salinivirgaceae bacterium]
MGIFLSQEEKKELMERKITFAYGPIGDEYKIEFLYQELFDLLLHKDYNIRLNAFLHSNGWLWCELAFQYLEKGETVDEHLCGIVDGKEEAFDFLLLFASFENVTIVGESASGKASDKLFNLINFIKPSRDTVKLN